jgi:hypothetical protein
MCIEAGGHNYATDSNFEMRIDRPTVIEDRGFCLRAAP